MLLLIPFAREVGSDWSVVSAWGGGGFAAAVIGFAQTRAFPAGLVRRCGLACQRRSPSSVALAEEASYGASTQLTVFVVAGSLGTAALGGLRSVQTVFRPVSLIAPAVSLPVLPVMVRRSSGTARSRLALTTSAALVVLTGLYVGILVALGPADVLVAVFGSKFGKYAHLLVPIAVLQVAEAGSQGFRLRLKADRRGPAIFWSQTVTGALTLGLVLLAAASGSLEAVAWAFAVPRCLSTALLAVLRVTCQEHACHHRRKARARQITDAAGAHVRSSFA